MGIGPKLRERKKSKKHLATYVMMPLRIGLFATSRRRPRLNVGVKVSIESLHC